MQNRDKGQPHFGTAGGGSDSGPDGGKFEPARQDFLIKAGSRCKTVIKAGQLPGSVLNVIKAGQTAVPMCKFPLKAKKLKTHVFAYVRARRLKILFFSLVGEISI